jgi:hypothetical protein
MFAGVSVRSWRTWNRAEFSEVFDETSSKGEAMLWAKSIAATRFSPDLLYLVVTGGFDSAIPSQAAGTAEL